MWGQQDNSKANTISDDEMARIQARARRANPAQDASEDARMRRGADNLRQARRGNN